MYCEKVTDSMRTAIDETNRRRSIQIKYNEEHGIEPKTIRKAINSIMSFVEDEAESKTADEINSELSDLSKTEVLRIISSLEDDMAQASKDMDYEAAARLRDQVVKLRASIEGTSEDIVLERLKQNARKGSKYGHRPRR